MHSEPNPLTRELARNRPPGQHPDADMLTAFAEGSLLKRERAEVLQHLSDCTECREIVNTSIDVEPEVVPGAAVSSSAAPKGYRLWMPWAVGLAACLVVAITVMTVHRRPNKTESGKAVGNVARVEQPQAPPLADELRPAEPALATRTVHAPASARLQKKPTSRENGNLDEKQLGVRPRSVQALPAPQQVYEAQSAGKAVGFSQAQADQQVRSANQMVEVSPSFAAAPAAPAPPPAQGSLDSIAKKDKAEAPAAKAAFPAGQPYMAGSLASRAAVADASARVHWRISPEGRVERQVGGGPWELELPAELAKMRVVSVYGGTVWAGGDEQRLYRSTDGGATWTLIALPGKGSGVHSITQVQFTSASAGVIETEDGTRWVTNNGGATWQ